MAEEQGELEALRQKVAELQKLLKSHVWTSAMATVANMEEATMGTDVDAEQVTLPRRIAALEKAVFGRSASEADLEHWNGIEAELKNLQLEYEELKLEYIKERDKPPEIIKQDDGDNTRLKQLEKDFKRVQGLYTALNQKFTALNVEHLKMETDFKDITKTHTELLEETTKFKAENSKRITRFQEQQTKTALELRKLRSANSKLWGEHQQLQTNHARVAEDFDALKNQRQRVDSMSGASEDLETECNLLREENDDLREKYTQIRKKLGLGTAFNETRRTSRIGSTEPGMNATTQALTSTLPTSPGAPAAYVAPQELCPLGSWQEEIQRAPPPLNREMIRRSVSLPRVPGAHEGRSSDEDDGPVEDLEDQEFFSKSPELREPKEQKVDLFQHRIFAINGKVKYCNERWKEWYFRSLK